MMKKSFARAKHSKLTNFVASDKVVHKLLVENAGCDPLLLETGVR